LFAVPELLQISEAQERADVYALLAALLLGPDAETIAALAELPRPAHSDDPAMQAWAELLAAAQHYGAAALDEYDTLFVAAGTPRINPYECHYRDGWLMDKPLARLRDDLRRLGLQRAERATELEDHLGALCESMAMLIRAGRPPEMQWAFFQQHLAGWAPLCLQDIASASGTGFHRALARFAEAFFELESQDVAAIS
jgi:TorA maturation chaperone TorD